MRRDSSLSEEQRRAAVALFDAGYGADAAARQLGTGHRAVGRLYDRWRVWEGQVLVTKATKRSFSFEFKREIVQRCLAGETKLALAQEFGLSSPKLIETWTRLYRREGEAGLRPKPKGRPRQAAPEPVQHLSELEQLRRENARLRAENAYLGKLRALSTDEPA